MAQKDQTQLPMRKTFKRTFLHDVSATVTFADTDLLSNVEALKDFLKRKFNIAEEFSTPKLSVIDIVSENRYESFHFTTTSASVTINANLYRFYEESLEPRLKDLVSFLKAIGVSTVETFTLQKRNVFPGTSSNAFETWKKALSDTFKEGHIQGMASTPGIEQKPFKMSIEGRAATEWGELRTPFSIEVPDKENFIFELDLIAAAGSVMINDLTETGTEMNDSIFEAFTKTVSDKLLDFLKQED